MFDIRHDDLSSAAVRELLALHLAGMNETSPAGSVFALDLSGLQTHDVTVWSVHSTEGLLGIGALKDLGHGRGEIKSMRTHPDHLCKGVAGALLDHIVDEARGRGMHRLSLETGSGPPFEAAIRLYQARGFVEGAEFGEYERSGFNRFLHLELR
jgi:putative acetyltransferase